MNYMSYRSGWSNIREKNSLEIHGVSESAYSTAEEVVLNLSEALEVPITPQDVEIFLQTKTKREQTNNP